MNINKVLASFKSITKLKAYRTLFNMVIASSLLSISSGVYARTGDMVAQNQRVQTDATPYIVGGTVVPAGQRTFQVYLSVQGRQYCGGSIIADNWVLTAAHCVDGTNIDTVVAGTQSLTSGGQRFSIAQTITHPQWVTNGFGTASDVALIRINGTFASNLERLQLATPAIFSSAAPAGTAGLVSGWGLTRGGDNNSASNQLLQVNNTVLSDSQCASLDGGGIDSRIVVCAKDAGRSSCNGDSGGPYTVVSNGVTYSIGIVSFGPTSCSDYSAYTKTSAFTSWIQSQIGASSGGGNPPPPPPPPGPTPSACPAGYTSFTGVIGAYGQAVPGGEYYAPAGVHASTNTGGTRVRLDLYRRGWYNWSRVASSTSSINYRGTRGTYALTVNGAPNTPYSVCARRP